MERALVVFALLTVSCHLVQRPEEDPLTFAARNGDVAQVRALLSRGANPDKPSGGNDWPPLMHAVHKNQIETAAALLDGGARIDAATGDGTTALMMAAAYGNDEMVKLLLARGADVRRADTGGATAIDHAIRGANDIDRFTLFDCQHSTVALLVRARPELRGTALSSTRTFARVKRCHA